MIIISPTVYKLYEMINTVVENTFFLTWTQLKTFKTTGVNEEEYYYYLFLENIKMSPRSSIKISIIILKADVVS